MKPLHALSILVLAFLAGCGGGGGGGGNGGAVDTPPPSGGSPPPGGETPPPGGETPPPGGETTPGGETPPGGSTTSSTAAIVFPWQKSSALGSSVVVRGKASDPDGVSAVRVNGADAVLAASMQIVSAKPVGSRVLAVSESQVQDGEGQTEVEWSLEIELEPGENAIEVTVEDTTGEETSDAADATITYAEVPELFTNDRDDSRLLGWNSSLTENGYVTQLVQFDLATQEQTVYRELTDIGIASCFRSQTNEFLYVIGNNVNGWQVRSFDLSTRTGRLLSDISAHMAPGPGFSTGPLLIQIVCSGVHEQAYVLANYWEDGDDAKSRIIEVEIPGNSSLLAETDPNEPFWYARRIALGDDSLVGVRDISAVAPLIRIALEDGMRAPLAPSVAVGALAMTAALELDRVYVTTFEGVEEIDLAAESKRNVSVAEPTDPLIFSQADSIALDLANNRVIVGDSDLDVLIAVDLATGARSELLSRKVGTGPPMIALRNIALNAAGTTAYVIDDGSNAAEKLFDIDLATGDRHVVGQVHEPGVSRSLTGLALDEEGGYVYVARLDLGTVLQVEIETEAVTPITSSGDGLLDGIEDVWFDAENQRLIVADSSTDAIVSVDVVTRQKELISRAGERGEGPPFETLVSLAMADDGNSIYAADQASDRILRVNLETGDREVVETTCALGSSESLRQILYDPTAHELLILSVGLFAFDLETSICTRIPSRLIPLGIALTPDGRILATDFNQLTQIDRQSGDVVIVSK